MFLSSASLAALVGVSRNVSGGVSSVGRRHMIVVHPALGCKYPLPLSKEEINTKAFLHFIKGLDTNYGHGSVFPLFTLLPLFLLMK